MTLDLGTVPPLAGESAIRIRMITNDAREFLRHLLETNSALVQNDVLNRIQESRDRLEVEIRKLLHEVSRIAEQALERARSIKEAGAPAVESALERLGRLEQKVSTLGAIHWRRR